MRKLGFAIIAVFTVGVNIVALATFLRWLAKTDFMFGHFKGPPEQIVTALYLSVMGCVLAGACIGLAIVARGEAASPRYRALLILVSLGVLLTAAPAVLIVPIGLSEWERARAQMRRSAVAHVPVDETGVEQHLLALEDEDYYVRNAAARGLAEAHAIPPRALPALIEAAARREDLTSHYAVQALAKLGPEASPAIPTLLELLDAPFGLGLAAGEALASIGGQSFPEVLSASHSGNAQIRASAALALGHYAPPSQDAVARLTDLLNDPEANVRAVAARSLGSMGDAAAAALPALDKAIYDMDPEARGAAERALAKIAEAASDDLRKYALQLRSPDTNHRANAAMALGARAPASEVTLPALREALQDPKPAVRLSAAKAIWQITGDAEQAIPTLIQLLNELDDEDLTLTDTLRFLHSAGPSFHPMLPALEGLSERENPAVRRMAEGAILLILNPLE